MRMIRSLLRQLLRMGAVTVAAAVVLWICAWLFRPNVSDKPKPHSPQVLAEIEKARRVEFDPNNTPSLHLKQKVTPVNSAPVLQDLEKQGQLPPVKDRMPEEPAVFRGVDGIGKYGGTWLRLANAPNDVSVISNRM